jgi:hypothetical protein
VASSEQAHTPADAAATPPKAKARTMELAMEQPYQGPVRQVISAWMALTMVAIAAFIVSVM